MNAPDADAPLIERVKIILGQTLCPQIERLLHKPNVYRAWLE